MNSANINTQNNTTLSSYQYLDFEAKIKKIEDKIYHLEYVTKEYLDTAKNENKEFCAHIESELDTIQDYIASWNKNTLVITSLLQQEVLELKKEFEKAVKIQGIINDKKWYQPKHKINQLIAEELKKIDDKHDEAIKSCKQVVKQCKDS